MKNKQSHLLQVNVQVLQLSCQVTLGLIESRVLGLQCGVSFFTFFQLVL